MKKDICSVCKKEFAIDELTPSGVVNDYLVDLIRTHVPEWHAHSSICARDLNHFRALFVREALRHDLGEITDLENEVVASLRDHEVIAENLNREFEQDLTFGERLSDRIAEFGGSWKFISIFIAILILWIVFNSFAFAKESFDPYPYILLNLVLSCVAALQAPVIMMSQNRQESKDRLRAELDYKVNLKAELEIRHLKARLDQLASHQWRRLLEIQELQTDLIAELARNKNA